MLATPITISKIENSISLDQKQDRIKTAILNIIYLSNQKKNFELNICSDADKKKLLSSNFKKFKNDIELYLVKLFSSNKINISSNQIKALINLSVAVILNRKLDSFKIVLKDPLILKILNEHLTFSPNLDCKKIDKFFSLLPKSELIENDLLPPDRRENYNYLNFKALELTNYNVFSLAHNIFIDSKKEKSVLLKSLNKVAGIYC